MSRQGVSWGFQVAVGGAFLPLWGFGLAFRDREVAQSGAPISLANARIMTVFSLSSCCRRPRRANNSRRHQWATRGDMPSAVIQDALPEPRCRFRCFMETSRLAPTRQRQKRGSATSLSHEPRSQEVLYWEGATNSVANNFLQSRRLI